MALSTKLELRQGQQLVMTPQLQQAIRLLQLSNMELMAYVDSELERNPLLEQDDGADSAPRADEEAPEFAKAEEQTSVQPVQEEGWLDLGNKSVADAESTYDTDYDNVYPDAAPAEAAGGDTVAPRADSASSISRTRNIHRRIMSVEVNWDHFGAKRP